MCVPLVREAWAGRTARAPQNPRLPDLCTAVAPTRRTLPRLPIRISALRRPRGAPSAGATCFARLLPRVRFYPSKNRVKRTSKKRTPVYQWAAKVAKTAHQNRPSRRHFRRGRAIALPCRAQAPLRTQTKARHPACFLAASGRLRFPAVAAAVARRAAGSSS